MTKIKLENHVFETYRSLRLGIALVALFFPTSLIVIGVSEGYGLQESWSAYYHRTELTGILFVGTLVSIGVVFILYKGFSQLENYLLNVAGLLVIGVTVFPMNAYEVLSPDLMRSYEGLHGLPLCTSDTCNTSVHWDLTEKITLSLHGFCAVGFLLTCALVALICSSDTTDNWMLILFYRVLGTLMVLLPALIVIYNWFLDGKISGATFIAESVALAAFVVFWWVKTYELLELRTAGQLTRRGLLEGMGLEP